MGRTLNDFRKAGFTRDARGKSVKLLDPVPLFALGRGDVIEREALDAIVADIDPNLAQTGSRGARRLLVIGLSAGVVLFVVFGAILLFGSTGARGDLVSTLMNPAIMVPCLTGALLPWFITRSERLRKLKRVMLHHRRCPHCGYGLQGLPPEDDGATLCPECGCAWQLSDGGLPAATSATRPRPTKLTIALTIALTISALLGVVVFFLVLNR